MFISSRTIIVYETLFDFGQRSLTINVKVFSDELESGQLHSAQSHEATMTRQFLEVSELGYAGREVCPFPTGLRTWRLRGPLTTSLRCFWTVVGLVSHGM